jgi:hypothetical protein
MKLEAFRFLLFTFPLFPFTFCPLPFSLLHFTLHYLARFARVRGGRREKRLFFKKSLRGRFLKTAHASGEEMFHGR